MVYEKFVIFISLCNSIKPFKDLCRKVKIDIQVCKTKFTGKSNKHKIFENTIIFLTVADVVLVGKLPHYYTVVNRI